jgi:anthranilate/para-aminobenzoate synthase component II
MILMIDNYDSFTLYIGLAKDQRIGIWIVTLGRRGR